MADLLPNLKPLKGVYPPYVLLTDCYIVEDDPDAPSPNTTTLRFSNGVANVGNGPLEVVRGPESGGSRGRRRRTKRTAPAIQRIYQDDGTHVEHKAGKFTYHEEHGHWHFDGFSSFELLDSNGTEIVKSKKQAFCMIDVVRVSRRVGGPTSPQYFGDGCQEARIEGISVGWADVYWADLPGQYIDITDVDSGIYWVRSISNPEKLLKELDGNNSSVQIRIQINKENNRVKILRSS
jgi:hypothetical protein